MIYLDNASTTRVSGEVAALIADVLTNDYFNPSSLYAPSAAVSKRIDGARGQIAGLLNVPPSAVFFTSGATESNNFAVICGHKNKRGNIVTSAGEHASVYEPLMSLKNKGADVRFAPVKSDGSVDGEKLLSLIDADTSLVSVIHRSNETGAVNDIARLSSAAKSISKNLLFHSDGVQFFGKSQYGGILNNVDLYCISAHKVGGPKGTGAVYIKPGLKLQPLIYGGGQERGVRSGTENCAGILGFARAAQIYAESYDANKIRALHSALKICLLSVGGVKINTADECSHIISASVDGVNAEILQRLLCSEGVLIGLGSACASSQKNNRVLKESGLSAKQIAGSIRISLSPETTTEEIEDACGKIAASIIRLRGQNVG